MRRSGLLLSGLLVLMLGSSPLLAAPGDAPKKAKKQPGKGKTGLKGYYGIVASVCKLTDEQVAKLKEALKPYEEARAKLNKDNAELRKGLTEAKKAKDEAKLRELGAQRKKLSDQRKAVEAMQKKAMDVLTEEQKATLEGHQLYVSSMRKYKRLGLEEAQQAKIRDLCVAKGKEILAADNKTKGAIRKAVSQEIEENVLTAEQRTALKQPPKKPAKPEKKAPAKGKKKAAE